MDTDNVKKGFTALEILVSLAILTVLFALSAAPLLSFYHRVVLQGSVENVLTMLDEARKSTLSSFHSSQYGVHFETDEVTLFRGSTYSAVDPNNDVYTLNSNVEVTTVTLNGGGDDVIFDRITGESSQDGTIVITQLAGGSSSSTISIHPSGLVEVN